METLLCLKIASGSRRRSLCALLRGVTQFPNSKLLRLGTALQYGLSMPKLVADKWLGLSSVAWDGIAAIATVAAFGAAVLGAFLVLRQLKQARELAEDQARPYLVATIEESAADWTITDFVVRNIGQTAARELTMTIDPPYVRAHELGEGNQFMDAAFIAGRTSVLPPGGELRTYLDSSNQMAKLKKNPGSTPRFTATLGYRDRLGKEITESFEIDPYERDGIIRTDVHGLHHIAKSVRAWTKSQGINSY
jgi:hypothetical protein